jgi:DNA-binding NarL/FixJ family response regulator
LAQQLPIYLGMRSILISNDPNLLNLINNSELKTNVQIEVLSDNNDPLDVMSAVCEANPHLIIVDDDFLYPETVHFLQSIRKVNRGVKIIFCTSNNSIELGKEVSQLGIQYYAMKPLDKGELLEAFNAALKAYNKNFQPLTK